MRKHDHDEDTVNRLIEHCHSNPQAAENLFTAVIAQGRPRIQLEGEEIELSQEERGEFAARFSAEVEPALWQSKRRKDQI